MKSNGFTDTLCVRCNEISVKCAKGTSYPAVVSYITHHPYSIITHLFSSVILLIITGII